MSNDKNCKECNLFGDCKGPVPPTGPTNARLVIVGESPGFEEDKKGEPFVGDTGKLLNYMLKEVGLVRNDLRITNAIKCYPNKKKLTNKHANWCKPILLKELEKLKNLKCIVAFGNSATLSLLNRPNITEINGYWWEWNNIPVLSLLHPAYVLRNLFYLDIQIKHLKKVFEVINNTQSVG